MTMLRSPTTTTLRTRKRVRDTIFPVPTTTTVGKLLMELRKGQRAGRFEWRFHVCLTWAVRPRSVLTIAPLHALFPLPVMPFTP